MVLARILLRFPCMSTPFSIFFRRDLAVVARDEEGMEVVGEEFYVLAEAPDGRRWVHRATFWEAARAQRLVDRITATLGTWAGPRAPLWTETSPCYGSEAYGRVAGREAARDELADGTYERGSMREHDLRARAA